MKAKPIQVRFEQEDGGWLKDYSSKTKVSQVDLIRLAVYELRKKYRAPSTVAGAQCAMKMAEAAR